MSNVKCLRRRRIRLGRKMSNAGQRGSAAIITSLLILFGSLVLVSAFSSLTMNEVKIARNQTRALQSYYAAEGGVEDLLYRIKNAQNYSPTENFSLNGANVNVSVTGDSEKTITAQGDLSDVFKTAVAKIRINTQDVQFHYGVEVGAGGLEMENNSTVSGNIYSNGPAVGASGTTITGDIFVASSLSQGISYATQNADQEVGRASPVLDVAQSFRSDFTGQIGQVSLYLKKTGSPGDKTVRIMGDSGGNPNKNNVLTSGTLSASLVTSNYGWVNVTFSSLADVTQNSVYWIMISSSANASNYYLWGKDSSQGFADGVAKYSSNWNAGSPTWTSIAGDLDFKIWRGGVNSLSNMTVKGNAYANTITNSKICGDAYYQTIDSFSLNFVNNPNSPCTTPYTPGMTYPNQPDPAPQNMPISDGNLQEWRAQAESYGVYSDAANCTPANGAIVGPGRFDCDFTVQNGKTITIKTPLWVKGNVLLDNNVVLVLDASYNELSGVILADDEINPLTVGTITVRNNVDVCGSAGYNSGLGQCYPSTNGSYLMLLSTYAGTASKAIKVENNVGGGIFYATAGSAEINNNTSIKEVIAYKLELANNAAVVYESGLANAKFSSGPGASYEITEWEESE